MRRLSDFGEGLFLIGLGIVMLFIIQEPDVLNEKNTNIIEGILREYPKEGVHDENQDYVGLWIVGYDNFYEFSGCSHNDNIHEKTLKLAPGDYVFLFTKKESSNTTYPWKGKKYKTFSICDAYSPKLGQIVKFEEYNRCSEKMAKVFLPILCAIMILIGVFRLVGKFFAKDNIIVSEYFDLSTDSLENKKDFYILKPDKIAYVLRNSGLPLSILSIVSGIILINPLDPEYENILGNICIYFGVVVVFFILLSYGKVFYILDNKGIHIRTAPFFFKPEVEFIPYYSIKEVDVKIAFYEQDRKIGTIEIHDGKYDDDGDKVYSTLAGLKKYKEIADFIKSKSNINQ